jgi:hypothetical protein
MEEDSKLYRSIYANAKFERNDIAPSPKAKLFDSVIIDDKESDRIPLKVEFIYDLQGMKGAYCSYEGQVINWTNAIFYKCQKKDLLTNEKEKALKETLNNVREYFSRMIRVKHTDLSSIGFKPETDHGVTIQIATYNTTTIGQSGITSYIKKTEMPCRSVITFATDFIPTAAENYDTDERFFFNVCVHELIHSIGFSRSFYESWVDKSTGMKYDDSFFKFRRGEYQKEFLQLCTPKAKEVAQKRFNKTKDQYGNPFCLEIEDLGGQGTQYVHPKATIFRQELMSGIASYDNVLSEVVLAIIDDMGWYTVNWSMAEPLAWGAKELLSAEELSRFTEKPAWKNLPESYLCHNTKYAVGHDYKSYGKCSGVDYNIVKDELELKKFGDLYIPDDGFISYNSPFDYTALKIFNNTCGKGKWAFVNEMGTNGTCLNGEISGDKFLVKYNNEEIECETGKKIGEWVCPDPKVIQKIDEFLNKEPYDYGHVKLYGEDHMSNAANSAISIFVVIVVLVVIVLVIWFFVNRKSFMARLCCCINSNDKEGTVGDDLLNII